MTSEGYFKNLDIDLLKSYAAQWVQDFDYIEFKKIELRRYATPRRLAKHYSFNPKTLYAIIFRSKMREENGAVFHRFCAEIGYRQTVPDEKYSTLFGEDFKNVYQRGAFPGGDYLFQWKFIPLAKGEELPLSVDNDTEPLVLYPVIDEVSDQHKEKQKSTAINDLPEGYIGRFEDKKNGIWEITYKGKTVLYNDIKGLQYIAMLLEKPNDDIAASVLVFGNSSRPEPKGKQPQSIGEHPMPGSPETHDEGDDIFEHNVRTDGDLMSDVALNTDELGEIENCLQQLYDRTQTSPDEQAQVDFDEGKAFYEKNEKVVVVVDKKGKVYVKPRRKITEDGEKARLSVLKAINYAFKKIEEAQNHPDLLDFLQTHITKGGKCVYKVDTALDHKWDVVW